MVAFSLLFLAGSTSACAQTFFDDFNRPDGAITNGWGSWNGSVLSSGQLEAFGSEGVGGGIFRSFPVILPLKFSFDFRSESPHPSCDIGNNLPGGGWLIAFNTPGEGYAGAQVEFLQYYGSQLVLRHYDTPAGVFEDTLPSTSSDFGPTFVHISGTVNADLSATLTIGSATYNFPPVTNPLATAVGSNLVLSNSSCGGGPYFFDNLSVTSGRCQVDAADLFVSAGGSLSLDGKPTAMNATFVPGASSGNPVGLAAKADQCGYAKFDWVQLIDVWPGPSGLFTESAPTSPIIVPPDLPFNDPPQGGYTYQFQDPNWFLNLPNFPSAAPFYYSPLDIPSGCAKSSAGNCVIRIMSDQYTLNYFDSPKNSCLPGGVNAHNPTVCQGLPTVALGGSFETQLVGVVSCIPSSQGCNSSGYMPSAPLLHWTWVSTFNGTSAINGTGRVSAGPVQTSSIELPTPNSGTGGITITSINGVPQSAPSVTCAATPNTLWPPNGKSVSVTVSGSVTAGTSALVPGKTTLAVADSQGEVQPSGSTAVGLDGTYAFTIPLVASREGSNRNGRRYAATVSAIDNIGNVGSCSVLVTVPHDQGH